MGEMIAGTLAFAGSDLTGLGFDGDEIMSGGVIGSGDNAITWTASEASSPVPEPATHAACLGVVAMGATLIKRRRKQA